MEFWRNGVSLSWLWVPPVAIAAKRLPQCVLGISIIGVALAFLVRAELGLGPWEVLFDGVHHQAGIALGTAAIVVGAVSMLVWIPLRQQLGLGTFVSVFVFGVVVNAVLPLVPEVNDLFERIPYFVAAVGLWGLGVAVYLAAGLGPGPRDGIMTAFTSRGYSVRKVRTIKEVTVLIIGLVLGGAVGVGTLIYAFTIGHCVHFFMTRIPAKEDLKRVGDVSADSQAAG